MDASTRRTRGVQRGPRSHRVVEKVRAATMAELARVGSPGLTIEGVAKAANVNRTTIYRRWPSKAALLLAVLEPGLERFDHDPDTGSLHGDLLAVMLLMGETAALPEGQAVHRAVGSISDELKELSCGFEIRRMRENSWCVAHNPASMVRRAPALLRRATRRRIPPGQGQLA